MDLKEVMAVNLRRARHGRQLTQEELADRAGLSTRYVGKIERAKVSASVIGTGTRRRSVRPDPGQATSMTRFRFHRFKINPGFAVDLNNYAAKNLPRLLSRDSL